MDHRQLAVEANNSTWEILGKPYAEITPAEADEMTHRAYAAAYHWARATEATPANAARASWLLSRVWVVQSNGALSLWHARACLAACESANLADFDLAYAYESLARAFACIGEQREAAKYRNLARDVAINEEEDRKLFESDLASEPWFGLP